MTPKIENYGSKVGGKNGGIVFDSFASGFGDIPTKTFQLTHHPINQFSVVVTVVTAPSTSTNIALKNVLVDLENDEITVSLTDVTGALRLCACYPTLDDLTV